MKKKIRIYSTLILIFAFCLTTSAQEKEHKQEKGTPFYFGYAYSASDTISYYSTVFKVEGDVSIEIIKTNWIRFVQANYEVADMIVDIAGPYVSNEKAAAIRKNYKKEYPRHIIEVVYAP